MRLRPRYPGLFFLALLTSIGLWYGVAGQRRERISEKRLLIPLTLINIPENLVITSDVPERVAVGLRGPLSALREAEAGASLDAVLDLASVQPGTRTFTIKESAIHVPEGVQVVSIDPPRITLKLERIETRQVSVEPQVEGTPAPGYTVKAIQTVPDSILISGPGSLLAGLHSIETTPVSVEGAAGPVEAEVEPVLPQPLLRPVTTAPLAVRVEVVPAPTPTPTPAPRSRRRRRR